MIMFRVNGIGIWYRILAAISNLSVLTNVNIINSIIDQKNIIEYIIRKLFERLY